MPQVTETVIAVLVQTVQMTTARTGVPERTALALQQDLVRTTAIFRGAHLNPVALVGPRQSDAPQQALIIKQSRIGHIPGDNLEHHVNLPH
ncbi:MAG: hypothetical protein N2509_09280, partial [Treponemataceae bacterium]|nr:hypothetical protein [Treponemataceae bacterium]